MSKVHLLGLGLYTVAEASRLAEIPQQRIRRWLLGYRHAAGVSAPLWHPGVPQPASGLEITFHDLIELRFVDVFIEAGVSLRAIRMGLTRARQVFSVERPFATHRFRTDGRRIFLEIQEAARDPSLVDLNKNQYAFRDLVAPSFKGLEFNDREVVRWRPWHERKSIVVDPARAFGAPIVDSAGVPTSTLLNTYRVANSFRVVANDFDVPEREVRDAVAFEERLAA